MSVTSSSSTPSSRLVPLAPAPDGAKCEDSNEPSTMAYTCVTCTKRKVRCDKVAPVCSTCRKARLDCVYQEPAPRKRKRKPIDETVERLEQYEKILKENGLLPKDGEEQTSPQARESERLFGLGMRPPGEDVTDTGKLVGREGKTRYVDAGIWKRLGDDIQSSSEDEGEDDMPPVNPYESTLAKDPASAALLSPNSPPASLLQLHPSYDTAMKLWKLYVENVDPIVKVVHVPTVLQVLQRAAANPSSASRSMEALLFAIYHFAITSIRDAECQKTFGEPKARMLTRYHDALRQALVNAHLLRTFDLIIVQAFILFLLSVRNVYDPHTFWILTGIAIRLGQRLGLHRDGEELGLEPFDVQIRRRCWWQLLPLDGLASQLCGTGICITSDSWSTKQPLNINDTDIWPEMKEPPEQRTGATDIIFCLARTEIAKWVQKANPPQGNWSKIWDFHKGDIDAKERMLTSLEEHMETNYVRYCDFANPVHNLTMAMARASVNSGRLRIRLPRAKATKHLPDEERKFVWELANRVLGYDIAAHNNYGIQRFMWHLEAFFQFDPLVWILSELRQDPMPYQNREETWKMIETTFNNHNELIEQKRSLHAAVARLVVKTWDTCISQTRQGGEIPTPEPQFITSVRAHSAKRSGSQVSLEPVKNEYNPFNPGDASDDLRYPNFASPQQQTPNDFDFNQMLDFNTDSMDWMFWDQLVRDPTQFPASWTTPSAWNQVPFPHSNVQVYQDL